MFQEDNYRFCTKLSLQIMREQRQRMRLDCMEKNTDLYMALHEPDPCVRNLRFQYYVVRWLDEHWSALRRLLEKHPEYTIDQRKQITLFLQNGSPVCWTNHRNL